MSVLRRLAMHSRLPEFPCGRCVCCRYHHRFMAECDRQESARMRSPSVWARLWVRLLLRFTRIPF